MSPIRRVFLVPAILIVFAGCAATSSQVYKLHPDPDLPDAELATLVFGRNVDYARLEGATVQSSDFGSIEVLPGEYEISFAALFGVSFLIKRSMVDGREYSGSVELEAGHHYTLRAERTYGYGYEMYLWIEDAASGVIVAGVPKP